MAVLTATSSAAPREAPPRRRAPRPDGARSTSPSRASAEATIPGDTGVDKDRLFVRGTRFRAGAALYLF